MTHNRRQFGTREAGNETASMTIRPLQFLRIGVAALVFLAAVLLSPLLGAATVDNIIAVIGGGSPSDPLAAGVGNLRAVAISPTGELHWTTGKQVVRRRNDGMREVVAGLDAFGDSPDGTLATASTYQPNGIAFDVAGNLYFAGNARVRKLALATGAVTTVVGTGAVGDTGDGGAATSAKIGSYLCLAFDVAGNLYISDSTYGRVRRVEAGTGIISTWAGIGVNASFNGDGIQGDTAILGTPKGIACDTAGNLFIADSNHNRVRRVDALTRIITTVAGNGSYTPYNEGGQATAAGLDTPMDVVVTSTGDLYISAQSQNRIRKVAASDGKITTVCGTGVSGFQGDNGLAVNARLNGPAGMVRDASGNLFICDVGNFRIRELVASNQNIVTAVGNGSDNLSGNGGQALGATLAAPCGAGVSLDNRDSIKRHLKRT